MIKNEMWSGNGSARKEKKRKKMDQEPKSERKERKKMELCERKKRGKFHRPIEWKPWETDGGSVIRALALKKGLVPPSSMIRIATGMQ
jgi:hypothetical protein